MKQISSLVAICVLIILFFLLATYVHQGTLGVGYLAGRFLGSFVILSLVIARVRRRRFRYDVDDYEVAVNRWEAPQSALDKIHTLRRRAGAADKIGTGAEAT